MNRYAMHRYAMPRPKIPTRPSSWRPRQWIGRQVAAGESGASAVEFSIMSVLVFAIVFGMFSGGLAWNTKQGLTHAARDGARYGATLPRPDETPAIADWDAWLNLVLDRTEDAAFVDLDPTVYPDRYVCVAYVTSNSNAGGKNQRKWRGTVPTGVSDPGTLPKTCMASDGQPDGEARVQIVAVRPYNFEAILFRSAINLPATAIARHEGE